MLHHQHYLVIQFSSYDFIWFHTSSLSCFILLIHLIWFPSFILIFPIFRHRLAPSFTFIIILLHLAHLSSSPRSIFYLHHHLTASCPSFIISSLYLSPSSSFYSSFFLHYILSHPSLSFGCILHHHWFPSFSFITSGSIFHYHLALSFIITTLLHLSHSSHLGSILYLHMYSFLVIMSVKQIYELQSMMTVDFKPIRLLRLTFHYTSLYVKFNVIDESS